MGNKGSETEKETEGQSKTWFYTFSEKQIINKKLWSSQAGR
jgi:hypothetical protein